MSQDAEGSDSSPPAFGDDDYRLLEAAVVERFGIGFPPGRKAVLAARLRERLAAHALSCMEAYCEFLRGQATAHEEWRCLAELVTNNETYFFREPGHFEELAELAPALASRGSHPLRVLSAGCSSGEEAYSLAMVLSQRADRLPGGFEVQGVDISAARLARARRGRFPLRSMRAGASAPIDIDVSHHFSREGDEWVARAELADTLHFRLANLVEPGALPVAAFDVIFCRNVLIYAPRGQLPRFLATLVAALRPGGYLFIGRSESLMGSGSPFRAVRLGEQFVYVLDDANPRSRSR